MKKRYETPELITTSFDTEDIITASGIGVNIDGGSTDFPNSWGAALSDKQPEAEL